MGHVTDQQILEALVQIGACDAETANVAIATMASSGVSMSEHLLGTGTVSRNDWIHALGLCHVPQTIARLSDLPDYDVVLTEANGPLGLPRRDTRFALIAHRKDRIRRCFLVAPEDRTGIAAAIMGAVSAAHQVGWKMVAQLTASPELIALIYRASEGTATGVASGSDDLSDLQREFDTLAYSAFKRGASDIHISVRRGIAQIAFRIHGELEHIQDMSEDRARELCAVVYNTLPEAGSTKEGFNPRATQDAVIERSFPEGMIRFRYSGLPLAPAGFDVTLRIIPIGIKTARKSMAELGYSDDQCDLLDRMFGHSSGMILFAGTTGSGKSTSLAHALMAVAEARPGKKIRTVEEPVEYRIEGAYQTPVTRTKGDSSDFLVVLRQLMRADPDIIMVGEIRDADTANLAIQAVRSGHLCVSTIHADGAPICYDRLAGMGIARQDLASVGLIVGLVYQRLVQVLCPHCKVPATQAEQANDLKDRSILDRVRRVAGSLDGIYFRRDRGCEHCEHRGVIGRTVCAEILRPTPVMLDAIATGHSRELWNHWRRTIRHDNPNDMTGRTAFEHAIWKMRQGIVSPVSVESEFRFLDEQPWEGV
jgi:type II secretory ATPase GspE/PulE/Tfp pilus assembly ATPase PilB-like protein